MADRRIEVVTRRAMVSVSGAALIAPLVQRKVEEVAAPDRAAAEAAAAQAQALYQEMLDIQALGDDAAAIAARAKRDGSNLSGDEPAAFRSAIGADLAANVNFTPEGTDAVVRTAEDKARESVSVFDFMTPAQIAAVKAGTSTDDTPFFTTALASAATDITVLPGTYRVAGLAAVAGKRLHGAGSGRTTLKIVSGSMLSVITGLEQDDVSIEGMTIDMKDAGDGSGAHAIFLNLCHEARIRDIRIIASPGEGLRMTNCRGADVESIFPRDITDVNAWCVHVEGSQSSNSHYSKIVSDNCQSRTLMVRNCTDVSADNIKSRNGGGTPLWFQNVVNCRGSNVSCTDGVLGDVAVIEGASIGSVIEGVTSTGTGGHGASIAGNALYGSPANCHIRNVYVQFQGECLAAISAQDSTDAILNCTITNVYGKNSGMGNGGPPVPSEAFAIVGATGCTIEGGVTDTVGNMPRAVVESVGLPDVASNNLFRIRQWVKGTAGYAQLVSSSSRIELVMLDNRLLRMGDADLAWNPAVHNHHVLYDLASLTADRTVTLGAGWANDQVTISHSASGSFSLLVSNGSFGIGSLAAGEWRRYMHNGTDWEPVTGGTI